MTKKNLGQYFTTSSILQELVFSLVKRNEGTILEPSVGAGHLLIAFKNSSRRLIGFEIDTDIEMVVDNVELYNEDFLKSKLTEKFNTIIGNPPFVRVKKSYNLYIKFIEKCYELLDENGELVFIVPSDFGRATATCKIIIEMSRNGCFTHLFYFDDERMFNDASVSVMIFRYERTKPSTQILVNNINRKVDLSCGFFQFINLDKSKRVSELFDVFVGIVSGCDDVFKKSFGNIQVLNSRGLTDTFILVNEFPTNSIQINTHLLKHKTKLENRKICKITEKNWFKWGALRNIELMHKLKGRECIYVNSLTRSDRVAFIGQVQLFGGGLICLVPKDVCDKTLINDTMEVITDKEFDTEHRISGRFKITHKMLSNVLIR